MGAALAFGVITTSGPSVFFLRGAAFFLAGGGAAASSSLPFAFLASAGGGAGAGAGAAGSFRFTAAPAGAGAGGGAATAGDDATEGRSFLKNRDTSRSALSAGAGDTGWPCTKPGGWLNSAKCAGLARTQARPKAHGGRDIVLGLQVTLAISRIHSTVAGDATRSLLMQPNASCSPAVNTLPSLRSWKPGSSLSPLLFAWPKLIEN